MHMKNKNIYRDTVRWMLLPVLSNVIYEVLKLSMVFIVAYFLGRVTDAAIAGKYDVFLDKGNVLLLIIAIGAVCVPLAAIAMDFIWIKAGSVKYLFGNTINCERWTKERLSTNYQKNYVNSGFVLPMYFQL